MRRWIIRALVACSTALPSLAMQAAAEYALKSGQSAAATANQGEKLRIGVCSVDAQFFSCAAQNYPTALTIAIILICVLLWRLAYRRGSRV
jgi:hypothetical protein